MWGELNDGNRKYRGSDTYLIFAKIFTPCIIPKYKWKTCCYEKRYCDYVTASDEAFMIWAFTNYNDWWYNQHKETDSGEKPLWTSGGKSTRDGSTAMGCGVTKEGLEIYYNIYKVIKKERRESRKFDEDFLNSKKQELGDDEKKIPRKRKEKEEDEYIDVHRKLMRAMAEDEGSDFENWTKC